MLVFCKYLLLYLFSMNFLTSFGTSSTPKLSKYVIFSAFTYKAIQWVPIDLYSSRFITYARFFIFGILFLPKDPPDYPILCNWVFDNFI